MYLTFDYHFNEVFYTKRDYVCFPVTRGLPLYVVIFCKDTNKYPFVHLN